jgi:hypothetical protein
MSWSRSSASCTIWRIRATNTRPPSVGSTPLAARTNSWLPTSRSTDWMPRDSADWLSPSAVAARAKLP